MIFYVSRHCPSASLKSLSSCVNLSCLPIPAVGCGGYTIIQNPLNHGGKFLDREMQQPVFQMPVRGDEQSGRDCLFLIYKHDLGRVDDLVGNIINLQGLDAGFLKAVVSEGLPTAVADVRLPELVRTQALKRSNGDFLARDLVGDEPFLEHSPYREGG